MPEYANFTISKQGPFENQQAESWMLNYEGGRAVLCSRKDVRDDIPWSLVYGPATSACVRWFASPEDAQAWANDHIETMVSGELGDDATPENSTGPHDLVHALREKEMARETTSDG